MVPAAVASTPSLLWLYLAGGGLLGLAALVLILIGLFRDKGRGTRRCPSCWYDMESLLAHSAGEPALASDPAATPPRCPECGRVPKSLKHLSKRRRRLGLVALGGLLALAGAALALTPTVREHGWRAAVPTTLLILSLPSGDELLNMDLPATFDPAKPAASALEELVRRWNDGRPPAPWQLRWLCSRMPMIHSRPLWVADQGYVILLSIPSWFPENVSALLMVDDAVAIPADFTTQRLMKLWSRGVTVTPTPPAGASTSTASSASSPALGAYTGHVYGGAPSPTSHITLKLHTIANQSFVRTTGTLAAAAPSTTTPLDVIIDLPTPRIVTDLSAAMTPDTSPHTTQLVANSITCTLSDVVPEKSLAPAVRTPSPYAWLTCTSNHAKMPCTVGVRVELLYDGKLDDARILVNDDLRFELRKLPAPDIADPAKRARYSVRVIPEPGVCLDDIDASTYWSGTLIYDMPASWFSPSTPLTPRTAATPPSSLLSPSSSPSPPSP